MNLIIRKTFGGLSKAYYFRQLFFAMLIFVFYTAVILHVQVGLSAKVWSILFFTLSTLLYPYSRFVYESIVNFIIGDNRLYLNANVVFGTKLVTVLLCWAFAIFISPIGLTYLYFHHSKNLKIG